MQHPPKLYYKSIHIHGSANPNYCAMCATTKQTSFRIGSRKKTKSLRPCQTHQMPNHVTYWQIDLHLLYIAPVLEALSNNAPVLPSEDAPDCPLSHRALSGATGHICIGGFTEMNAIQGRMVLMLWLIGVYSKQNYYISINWEHLSNALDYATNSGNFMHHSCLQCTATREGK